MSIPDSKRVFLALCRRFPRTHPQKPHILWHFRSLVAPFTFLRSRAVSASLLGVHSRVLFFRNENAEFTESLLCSQFTIYFTGEWFTNHSTHIHRFTPIIRIVATKFRRILQIPQKARLSLCCDCGPRVGCTPKGSYSPSVRCR